MPHAVLRRRRTTVGALGAALAVVVVAAGPVAASGGAPNALSGAAARQAQHHAALTHASPARTAQDAAAAQYGGSRDTGDALEVADHADQYAGERSAPGTTVSAAALLAARPQAASLPAAGGSLTEITARRTGRRARRLHRPGVVQRRRRLRRRRRGRTTALAVDGNTYYAGTADGGVWKSTDRGQHWTSDLGPASPRCRSARCSSSPDHALWVGTGEANTSSDSYLGRRRVPLHRRWRQLHPGRWLRAAWTAPASGCATTAPGTSTPPPTRACTGTRRPHERRRGQLVLKPDPNPTGSPVPHLVHHRRRRSGPAPTARTCSRCSGGATASSYNGFYLSTTGGGAGSFAEITPAGAIDATDIGRTTLAYAADGSRLYAIVQSPKAAARRRRHQPAGRVRLGLRRPGRPVHQDRRLRLARRVRLGAAEHAGLPRRHPVLVQPGAGGRPDQPDEGLRQPGGGVPDQRRRRHASRTASPYWNYGLACGARLPAGHPPRPARARR